MSNITNEVVIKNQSKINMNDLFVVELLNIAVECQKAGVSNAAIIHELSQLRHRAINLQTK